MDAATFRKLAPIVILGVHHEQQHQELIVTDLKHAWSLNPLGPIYREAKANGVKLPPHHWITFPEGVAWIGHDGSDFAFDNESPRHRVFIDGFQLSNRLVTNAEYLAFMADGGYERSEFWLSDGWAARQAHGWNAPLYWEHADGAWTVYTLAGRRTLAAAEPVCHVSYYEADAFARWAGSRLPTEAEWEVAAGRIPVTGHFQEAGRFQPASSPSEEDQGPLYQMFGDVWQWTASPYVAYPGYRPLASATGEYNGKFMCNQMVLRVRPAQRLAATRRDSTQFFPPDARWQFSGVRLAGAWR